jgi:hypothetical protein
MFLGPLRPRSIPRCSAAGMRSPEEAWEVAAEEMELVWDGEGAALEESELGTEGKALAGPAAAWQAQTRRGREVQVVLQGLGWAQRRVPIVPPSTQQIQAGWQEQIPEEQEPAAQGALVPAALDLAGQIQVVQLRAVREIRQVQRRRTECASRSQGKERIHQGPARSLVERPVVLQKPAAPLAPAARVLTT